MNLNRETYQDTEEKGREKTVQKLFEIRAIQLLLAGVYFLFGIKFTKADKALQRERAIIMRKSISAANLEIDTKRNNTEAFRRFTNDHGPSWRARMKMLSSVPRICAANIRQAALRDLLAGLCQVAGRSSGAARRLKAGNTKGANISWLGWNDSLVCRAPP